MMTGNVLVKPRIGVSACLLGHEVRYDGGHRENGWLTSTLSKMFEFIPVCPEMAIGLGVPRPPIELTGSVEGAKATGLDNPSMDVTQALRTYAQQTAAVSSDLSGFIFKGKSPSCGLNVRLNGDFMQQPVMGVFSQVIHERLPMLPIIDIEALESAEVRDNFLSCVSIYQSWKDFVIEDVPHDVVTNYQKRCKQLLLSCNAPDYK